MTDADREPDGRAPEHAGFGGAMRIDWLGADELTPRLPGRLGLTFLPGKRGASSRYPGHVYRRDAAEDMLALRRQGVRHLVLLVEDAEISRWSDPQIVRRGTEAGLTVDRFPIPDGAAPTVEEMDRILAAVESGRRDGDVAVACMRGVGRTGTVAACALVQAGLSADEAIARVRQVRHPTAVETAEQEALVASYSARWPKPGTPPS